MIKKFGKAFKKVKKTNLKIKYLVKEKSFQILILSFSNIFKLPKNVIEYEVSQILSKNYDYKNEKIRKILSIKNFIKNFILTFALSFLMILTFFLKKKTIKKKRFEIIVDGVVQNRDAYRLREISKNFKTVCFISKKKFLKDKNITYFNHSNFFLTNNEFSIITRINFFIFCLLLFLLSIFKQKNFYFIFFEMAYKILKYNFIFKSVISKSYLQSKFYDTSAIKNYIFKANGGIVTSCTQKNLLEVGLSSFINIDIFFSIGKNTGNLIWELDGYCKKVHPVGSLFMEGDWFKRRKDLKKVEKSDLLVLGINTVLRHYKLHITDAFDKNYYEFIKWIGIFSNKFPKLKIVIKHHGNFPKDKKEIKLISNTNIKLQINNHSINGSYASAFKSKVLCSFGSTMIFELLGHNIPGFYVDPGLENQQFFELLPQSNKWRLKNYNEFEKKILQIINGKKFLIKNKDLYCLDSKTVSKRIAKYLKNYK